MRVIIDGDACPNIDKSVEIAQEHETEIHIFCDTSHYITSEYAQVHIVDKGHDSVDFAILSFCQPEDVVMTGDNGLAAMCLVRGCRVINNAGKEITEAQITKKLNSRYAMFKIQRGGSHPKRSKKSNQKHKNNNAKRLDRILKGGSV